MQRGLYNEIRMMLKPITTRLANTVARGVVQLVDDSVQLQLVQLGVLVDEDVDDGERFQEYGFTSVPLPGAEAVVLFADGDRTRPLIVGVADRDNRLTGLADGEVAVYSNAGSSVILRANGDVEVTAAGEVKLGSDGAADPVIRKSDLDQVVSTLNSHTHLHAAGTGASIPTATPLPQQPPVSGSGNVKAD